MKKNGWDLLTLIFALGALAGWFIAYTFCPPNDHEKIVYQDLEKLVYQDRDKMVHVDRVVKKYIVKKMYISHPAQCEGGLVAKADSQPAAARAITTDE
jgi:hypothetical protein